MFCNYGVHMKGV